MNFRMWLENERRITKLAVFDYDGTLAQTPDRPPEWKPTPYIGPDGRKRSDTSWWVHPDSLADYQFNQTILEEFRKARTHPNTKAVILTGRMGMRTAHLIRGKLRQDGLYGNRMISPAYQKSLERHDSWPNGPHPEEKMPHAHDEYFSGDMRTEDDFPKTPKGNPTSDTLAHKKYVVERKLMTDDILEIDFWDDRVDHHEEFKEFFQRLVKEWPNLGVVNYHYVTNGRMVTIPISK